MSETRVALIGLGNIGRARSPSRADTSLQPDGLTGNTHAANLGPKAKAADLPTTISQSNLIFICVGDDAALDAVVSSIFSLGLELDGKTFINCSTVHPDTSRRTETSLWARGAEFVACPVFGAPNMADAGQLVIVPAGKQSAIEKARPFFDGVVARKTIDLSAGSGADIDVGRASLLKLLGNTFILNTVGVLAESLVAAEASGLGVGPLMEWLGLIAPGPFANYAERMTSGDYYWREEPLAAVDLARKDLRHAAAIAGEGGLKMRNVEITDALLREVKEECGEKGDIAGVYGAVRKGLGWSLRITKIDF